MKNYLFRIGLLLLATGYITLAQTPHYEEFKVVVQLAWWGIWQIVIGGGLALISIFFFKE